MLCLHLKLVHRVGKVKTVPSWHFNCLVYMCSHASIEMNASCLHFQLVYRVVNGNDYAVLPLLYYVRISRNRIRSD